MKIGVIGWYGYGNLGDEALLDVVINDLSKFVNKKDILVFSEKPDCVKSLHKVESIIIGYEGKLSEFVEAVEKIDILIWGGGGSFSDWQNEALPNIFKILCIVKSLNKKIFLYSIGCGPISTINGKKLMKKICEVSDLISVRDQGAFDLLNNLNINNLYLTSDPVVKYDVNDMIKNSRSYDSKINFGVCVSYLFDNEKLWHNKSERYIDYKSKLIELLIKINKKYSKSNIYFIPVFPKDEEFALELISVIKLKNIKLLPYSINYKDTIKKLSNMDIIISTRLHPIILGSLFKIPSIGMIINAKTYYYLKAIKLEKFCIHLGDGIQWPKFDFKIDETLKNIEYILGNMSEIQNIIYNNVEILKDKQEVNGKLLKKLFEDISN